MYKTPADMTAGCHSDEAWGQLSPQGAAGFLIRPEAYSAGYSAGVAEHFD